MTAARLIKQAEKAARAKEFSEAIELYRRVLDAYPKNARARIALTKLEEMPFHEQLVDQERSAYLTLVTAIRQSNSTDAVMIAQNLRALASSSFALINLIAEAMYKIGRIDEAVKSYERATEIRPQDPVSNYRLSVCQAKIGLVAESLESVQRAISAKPGYVEAYKHAGAIAMKLWDYSRAAEAFATAVELAGDDPEMHYWQGMCLQRAGKEADAVACFNRASALSPSSIDYRFAAQVYFRRILPSESAIEDERTRFEHALDTLSEFPGKFEHESRNLADEPYMLAYHARNNRGLKIRLASLLREKSPQLNFVAQRLKGGAPAGPHDRIRVGFCSEHLCNHTIGKLFGGLLEQLDRSIFEVYLLRLASTKKDAVAKRIGDSADRIVTVAGSLSDQQSRIAECELDVLFYPDIGMSTDIFNLAFARLAPVQCVSWGHPDTTGIDTIDYFVSSNLIESDTAGSHYSERLVRLPRLPCYYPAELLPAPSLNRTQLGLPDSQRLYGCPQTLFKFHPEFDQVLADIAKRDPDGQIILVKGQVEDWVEPLKHRWAKNFPDLEKQVIFLDRLQHSAFMSLLAECDVLLDPIHFGSGNTLYEALSMGTPVVTWRGEFMRGRIVAGAYQQMELDDAPIADSIADLAPLAVELARDRSRRAALSSQLKRRSADVLLNDSLAVREFETFLKAAISAANSNQRLEPGWRPQDNTVSGAYS